MYKASVGQESHDDDDDVVKRKSDSLVLGDKCNEIHLDANIPWLLLCSIMQALKNVRKFTNSGSLPRFTCGKLHFSQFRGSGASSTWKSGKGALPGMTGIFQSRFSRSVKCGLALVPLVASMAVVALADADPTANFITLESGLKYRDLKVGDGECPKRRDIVKVHYTGWLDGFDSGKKFDSSYDRHNPIAFKVGTGQVIAGKRLHAHVNRWTFHS